MTDTKPADSAQRGAPDARDGDQPAPTSAEAGSAPDGRGLAETLNDLALLLRRLEVVYANPPRPATAAKPAQPAAAPSLRASKPERAKASDPVTRRRFVFLAIVLVTSSILGPVLTFGSPARGYAIASQSMEPTYHKGTLVYASPGTPKAGDVVVYWSPLGNALEVHRVKEVRQENGRTYYVMRGDNNEASDSGLVRPEDVRGIVRTSLPVLGQLWLLPRVYMMTAFFTVVFVYILIVLWEADFVRRRLLVGAVAAGLVLLVLAPQVSASISPSYVKSTDTLNVATTPLPMSAGTMASATTTDGGNRATVTAAAPKLWKEIVMWGCDPTNLNSNPGCTITTPNAYAVTAGSVTKVDAADYSPAPTFFLEAYLKAPVAGQSTSVQLYDKTGAAAIGPELTSTSLTNELKRSTGFTLSGNKEYQFQTKDSSAGSSGSVYMVKLIAMQSFPTKTVTQIKVSGAADSNSNNLVDTGRTGIFRYESGDIDGATVYFEAVAETPAGSTNGAQVVLATTGGAAASTLSITNTMNTPTRVISGALTLTNGQDYKVQFKDGGNGGGNKITLHQARIIILQSSFTKTLRYDDLSWRTVLGSTTFTKVGFLARYQMDSEWGNLTGYFEATLVDSNGAQTATARLWDDVAGAAVTGSDVSVTGTTVTRVRSAAITLNLANATYEVELKNSGAANAEARTVFLIAKQTAGKTYDYALKATNSVGGCTWSFNMAKTSDANLARITSATVSVRGDSATQNQIVYSGGSYSQTSGTAVTVAGGNSAKILVFTNPASAGSSTINGDLQAVCNGVKTWQRVTFTLG